MSNLPLLKVSNIYKRFNLEAGFFAGFGRFVNAVNGVSISVGQSEAYGLVGESGCGKTTTARLIIRMYNSDSGEITYYDDNPVNVNSLKRDKLRQYREKVRYVFQDPAKSLNPRMSVYEVLVSGCRKPLRKRGIKEKELREKAAAILEEVGLQPADLERRPSEFSGGQRQRISIARALLMEPEMLICDEVVSALDVSIQGQILNLLLDIRKKRSISFLFIAHDLKVACYFCDRIGVMYSGEIMEEAPAANLYKDCLHPYTKLLFSCAAGNESKYLSKDKSEENMQRSEIISTKKIESVSANSSSACSFAGRCPYAGKRCRSEHPELKEINPGHFIRCWNLDLLKEKV